MCFSPDDEIRVTKARLSRAKRYGRCECKYCEHRGRCGEPLTDGWMIRLGPDGETLWNQGERMMSPSQFEALIASTTAVCGACAYLFPNQLTQPVAE